MINNIAAAIVLSLFFLACSEWEPQESAANPVISEASTQPGEFQASDASLSGSDVSGLANGGSSSARDTSQPFDAQIDNNDRVAIPIDSSDRDADTSDQSSSGGNAVPEDASTTTELVDEPSSNANPETPEPCDRACLIRFLDDYLNGMVAHDPNTLVVEPNLRATENGVEVELGTGVWEMATALRAFREDFVDVERGQAGSFVVLEENGSPVLMTLRLKVVGNQITEIETIVTRMGDHMFFAPDNLVTADPIFDEIVPEAKRLSREELERLANAYFDGLENSDGSMLVFDPQCQRLENGIVTASGTGMGNFGMFFYIEDIARRIPIVDEERGVAFGIAVFNMPSQARSALIGELFKIIDGRYRMIHAFMINFPFGTPSGW